MPIIDVSHVTKQYRLGTARTLRQTLASGLARLRGRASLPRTILNALDQVSFTIEPGEVVGFIGHNGAGKSTLLKLLARITEPSSGSVRVRGKVAPLIEVGAGLVGDLTGRENIYLNGAILGMRRAEIKARFDSIVAFAELEDFIDTPLKRYSSGMQVRLGFAIATAVPADILIVDEVLAVGDLAFQRKCYDRMQELLIRDGRTVLLVSHDLREIERICKRVLLLDHGRLLKDGDPNDVCNLFYEKSQEKTAGSPATAAIGNRAMSSGEVEVVKLGLFDEHGERVHQIPYEAPFSFRLRFAAKRELHDVVILLGFQTTDFLYLATHSSGQQLLIRRLASGEHELACKFERMPLLPGVYSLRVEIAQGTPSHGCFYGERLFDFRVVAGARAIPMATREGFIEIRGKWSAIAGGPGQIDCVEQGTAQPGAGACVQSAAK